MHVYVNCIFLHDYEEVEWERLYFENCMILL